MRYGLSLFPVLGPGRKSALDYFDESLRLVEQAERLDFEHVQIVEHYLGAYGGYSPDPTTFLAAAAMRTSRIRLVTGAVIPAFTHPLQLAGKLAMLDNLSRGRVGVGFGRAFLPAEFVAFDVPIDSSRERFVAGVEACRRLWSGTEVSVDDGFHRFGPVTSLPRTVQRPHPPIYLASAMSPETCAAAGREGYHLQVVPTVSSAERLAEMLAAYRAGWAEAGHPAGGGEIQVKLTCYLGADRAEVLRVAEELERHYVAKMAEAVAGWAGARSAAYPGYEQLAEKVAKYDFAAALRDDKVLAGTPDDVTAQIRRIRARLGSDIVLSCVFNPGYLPMDSAAAALELFAGTVVPAVEAAEAGAPGENYAGSPA
ncbi:LLM class flavin-dependent oxidoreductase [Amycolatopsis sp. A1MSW2902]|uniref:LLM class flavin-dependent oxidoreductase n=1 Tax=Amycolatopsis sp. A1MSW2902 TaxID=687413 RepID=UPI00307ED6DF